MKIKKGDKVVVLSGKNKGKKGKVLKVWPRKERVLVENVNMVKKHQRATQKFQGGIIEKPGPIAVSKVMLICPRCSKPARVGRKIQEDKRLRYCKRCKEIIDKL